MRAQNGHDDGGRQPPSSWRGMHFGGYPVQLPGHGSKLLHRAQHVRRPPVFGDLAVLEADDVDTREFNGPAGGRDAREVPLMGACQDDVRFVMGQLDFPTRVLGRQ